jgi:hypothetical protein
VHDDATIGGDGTPREIRGAWVAVLLAGVVAVAMLGVAASALGLGASPQGNGGRR